MRQRRIYPFLRTATRGLPLDAAAEVLVLLESAMATLEREAALALEWAPAAYR